MNFDGPGEVPTDQMVDATPVRCRVRVWHGPRVIADYSADPDAAHRYAESMSQRFSTLRISIDHGATEGLRPMPTEQLWLDGQADPPEPVRLRVQ